MLGRLCHNNYFLFRYIRSEQKYRVFADLRGLTAKEEERYSQTIFLLEDSPNDIGPHNIQTSQLDTISLSDDKISGGKSLDFSGGRRLFAESQLFSFWYDNFTIELWTNLKHIWPNSVLFELGVWPNSIMLKIENNALEVYCYGEEYSVNYNFIQDKWYHLVYQRRNGIFGIYLNGQEVLSFNKHVILNQTQLGIGYSLSSVYQRLNGLIDLFRISNIARYSSSSFSPPVYSQFPLKKDLLIKNKRPFFNYATALKPNEKPFIQISETTKYICDQLGNSLEVEENPTNT